LFYVVIFLLWEYLLFQNFRGAFIISFLCVYFPNFFQLRPLQLEKVGISTPRLFQTKSHTIVINLRQRFLDAKEHS